MMKALSLRQPWAWLVAQGFKPLENRRWNTRFRGDFLVHAAKGMTVDEYEDARAFALEVMGHDAFFASNFPYADELSGLRGGIVGRARLVDVVPPCDDSSLFHKPCTHEWHMGGQFGFQLTDIRALPFIPLKGELGFFEVTLVGSLATLRDAGDLR